MTRSSINQWLENWARKQLSCGTGASSKLTVPYFVLYIAFVQTHLFCQPRNVYLSSLFLFFQNPPKMEMLSVKLDVYHLPLVETSPLFFIRSFTYSINFSKEWPNILPIRSEDSGKKRVYYILIFFCETQKSFFE